MKRQLFVNINQKGGCSKSHNAFSETCWAIHHNIPYIGFDTDSSNASYGDYASFNIKSVETMDNDGLEIKPEKWDALAYYLLENLKDERLCIIDIGASQFQSFVSWSVSSNIFNEILKDHFDTHFLVPVAGGEMLHDTINGLKYLTELFSQDVNIVAFATEYFGELKDENNNSFEETPEYLEIKEQLDGVVYIRKMDSLQTLAVEKMKKAKLTPEETKLDERFKLLEKSRINTVMNNTYMMMDQIFDIPIPPKTSKTNTKKEEETTV